MIASSLLCCGEECCCSCCVGCVFEEDRIRVKSESDTYKLQGLQMEGDKGIISK